MQVEDEILSEIESRDTTIMLKEQEIRQKNLEIEQKSQEIEQKSQEIEQKSQEIEQKDREIEQAKQQLEQQRNMLCVVVKNMFQQGVSVKDIARMWAVSEDTITELLAK